MLPAIVNYDDAPAELRFIPTRKEKFIRFAKVTGMVGAFAGVIVAVKIANDIEGDPAAEE